MSDQRRPITVGSIIHLENKATNGGYLDTRGRVVDKPAFWNVAGTELQFVTTHENRDRDRGSGSWRVISAEGEPDGAALNSGDTIHLFNMYPNAGYLDACGWVVHLPPFKKFSPSAKSGVFTSGSPNRDNGTGLWKIVADGKQVGDPIYEDDGIYLENGFPENGNPAEGEFSRAGFLMTHGNVSENEIFADHVGQLKFAFTSIDASLQETAGKWTITLNAPREDANSVPVNTYYVWGQLDEKWVDLGVFAISGDSEPIVALNVNSTNEGDALTGTISYKGKAPVTIEATRIKQNEYKLTNPVESKWHLGGRDDRKIININVSSPDNGQTFYGTITYAGESAIAFKGIRATTTLVNGEPKTILYDFFQQDLWKARIERIAEALQTAVIEFDDVLLSMEGFSIEKLASLVSDAGGKSYSYLVKDFYLAKTLKTMQPHHKNRLGRLLQSIGDETAVIAQIEKEKQPADPHTSHAKYDHLNEKMLQLLKSSHLTLPLEVANRKKITPGSADREAAMPPAEAAKNKIDFDFQLKQLLNIYTLWLSMDEFWKELSSASIKSIEALNQAKILPPVDQIRACFRQFTMDFEIIQNSIRQRRWVKDAQQGSNPDIQSASLIVTDKLAARAMAPFKHLITDSTDIIPITFFSNRVYVRQLPYTDQFMFVGLSYDLTLPIQQSTQDDGQPASPPFELMAIPHEIGHFMYHHANLVKNRKFATFAAMSKQFKSSPYFDWCEEIFADLYGCLIAGPFAVLGMQALIATEEKEMVLTDDDEHPTGIFRPYFLSEMLRILSSLESHRYDFAKIAIILDTNWTAILQRWGYVSENIKDGRPARIHLPNESNIHTESFVNVDKALQLVNPIIETFARGLLAHAKFQPWEKANESELSAKIPWCIGNDAEDGALHDYIGEVVDLVDHKFASKHIPDIHLSSKSQMNPGLREEIRSALGGRNEFIGAQLFQKILSGWTDKGPHGWGDHA